MVNTMDLARESHQLGPCMSFRHQATRDYIAARCCILNALVEGLPIAATAIEKLLKAFILRQDPNVNPKSYNHDLNALVKSASESTDGLSLKEHLETISRLKMYYDSRYPGGNRPSRVATDAEMQPIDELMCLLEDSFPIRDELKFHSGMFAVLFFEEHTPQRLWLERKNVAIAQRYSGWRARFRAACPSNS